MRTDRECLEIIAKATERWAPHLEPFEHVLSGWNPAERSGDSFDLAAELKINIAHDDSLFLDVAPWVGKGVSAHGVTPRGSVFEESRVYGPDAAADARWVVLNVAADMLLFADKRL